MIEPLAPPSRMALIFAETLGNPWRRRGEHDDPFAVEADHDVGDARGQGLEMSMFWAS